MFRVLISFTPFMVCLFWLILFALNYRRHNSAKRVLTWFLLTCTVLYFCHGLFFTTGSHRAVECLWALCSLSVYPVYYLYIRALTAGGSGGIRQCWVLLPGFIVFLVIVFFPGPVADYLRMVLFTVQILCVIIFGIRMLKDFDKTVACCYANVDGRKMTDVRILLLAFVMTSIFSASANIIGKSFFAGSDTLLLVAALLFATMLFALSYIGYTRVFSYAELSHETADDKTVETPREPDEVLGLKLDKLMAEKKLFLEKNLKITDVAQQLGSCRTYVSNYINQVKGETFTDYINRLRIDEAKHILSEEGEIKNIAIAEQLGFANEQSFYRNFKKFTGLTPAGWKKKNSTSQIPPQGA